MIGGTILHYHIIKELGRGGMGVVYLAEDMKLKRQVAIKFIPLNISSDEEQKKRFELEAQAAASLNHPNISTIHSIEESENNLFIVMEFIDGIELKDKIKSGPIRIEEIIKIAIQIAEGLEAAHRKAIVHRDIKSQNIMITSDGKVKIMDFGLAKVGEGTQLTKVGSTVGTAAYMSPEQARGEEIDLRTDIWSFGVVLYEMITGKIPFKGDYEQAVIYSILNDEPEFYDSVSEGLKHIISRSLAKNKEERYKNASEIISDLNSLQAESFSRSYSDHTKGSVIIQKKKRMVPAAIIVLILVLTAAYFIIINKNEGAAARERKMIVVLPFENLGSSDDDYFADGITGEITSKLSGLSGLGVIARSSAMQYKNTKKTLRQVGEELGVQYVLEGTVQWEKLSDGKKRIRVNPELIDITNATQIWSKPYESDFSSAFTLQADIAATVADALNLTLINSEQTTLEKKITNNSEAYDIYLKAISYTKNIGNERNMRIAEEMFKEAISLDSNFAEAYAQLSSIQSSLYWEYYERTDDILKKSQINVQKALQLDPHLPQVHVSLGDYYYHGKLDYDNAIKEYNEAIRLDPNNVDAINGIAYILRRLGKMRETIPYFEKSLKLTPMDYNTVYSFGETYCLLREYSTGRTYLDKSISITPDAVFSYDMKARSYLLGGDIKTAQKVINDALDKKIGLDSKDFKNTIYFFNVLSRNFSEALNQIKDVNKIDIQFLYRPEALLSALVYKLMGNKTNAHKNFNLAVQNLEAEIRRHPEDSRLYSSLGLCYAGLGEKENAVREGRRGLELMPISKEAWRGTYRLLDLAQIYTMIGEQESALDAIEELLNKPTDAFSVWYLKLDPTWEPLKENPRYQKLIKIP